ncbi:MAG: InlB B-repeat-containing protein [Bacteroidales bacterium]|nr:InlB B-repeat-containing protein [Bacteroidales bacterium]
MITKPSKAAKALYCKSIEVTYTPSHTLTYSATTGGSITSVMNGSTSVSSGGKVVEGTTLNIVAAAESGYVFAGWTQTGTGNSFGNASNLSTTFTMGTANATITANFEETPTDPYFTASDVNLAYNVTAGSIAYTVNNPVQDGVVTAEITGGNEGSWLSRGVVTSTSVPLTCSANNMGQRSATVTLTYTYNTNQTVTKDVTVTQDPAEFTIIFHGHGGKTAGNATEYTQVNVVYNTETALTANAFTRDGYLFNNWNTEENGSGYSYNNQANVTLTGNLHLYAQWTIIPTYTLVTDVDDIVPGAHYVIVGRTNNGTWAMGAQTGSNTYRNADEITGGVVNNQVSQENLMEFVISGPVTSGNKSLYTIYDESQATNHFLNANGGTGSNSINVTNTIGNTSQWTIAFGDGDEAVVTANFSGRNLLSFNSSANPKRFTCYASKQTAIYLFKKDVDNNIHPYSSSEYSSEVTIKDDITLSSDYTLTVANGGVLTLTGSVSCSNASWLVVEDGGQLITTSANVKATVKKNITGAGPDSKDVNYHWNAISSSVYNAKITGDNANTNLVTSTSGYELYRYDEPSATWENYKASHAGFTTLQNGRGYLYRNEIDMTIEFTGTVNTSASYTVSADGPTGFTGFNLIGNPYTHEIYKGGAFPNSVTSDYTLSTGFYKLNAATGAWVAGTDNTTAIAPNEGFLVQATAGGTITIDNTMSKTRYNSEYLQFTVANSEYEDVAYAWFDKGTGLSKINHRNANIPMLYINQEGQDYAIATMSDDTKTFNLNFKAMTTGKYTLSYKANGEFSYLHVIDRFTGEDIDMLLEGEYSFIGSSNDNDARFIVKLGYMPNYSDEFNDIFAYQNGNEILVSGEGELQIFDVTGRMIMNTKINGAESISIPAQGVYIFRLVGNEIKTQKIVVR